MKAELIAGMVSGIATTICSHPLETIKVRQQTFPASLAGKYSSPSWWKIGWIILHKEGPKALFQGIFPPLLSRPYTYSLGFGLYHHSQAWLSPHHSPNPPHFPHFETLVAGTTTGIAISFLTTPTELVKTKLQHQNITFTPPPA
eukprot:Sdes_comp18008_c0_seq1m7287